MLSLSGVRGGYKSIEVLHGVSLQLANETVGMFGPNGHGKTTTLRAISGLVSIQDGQLELEGQSLLGVQPMQRVEQGLLHVPQGSQLFPAMQVEEALLLGAYPRRAWIHRRATLRTVYDLFPRLHERRVQRCRTLSGGERQMAAIGVGLMGLPRVLLLDEPTLGLSPVAKEALIPAIRQVASRDISLLIVDQDIEFLDATCDRLLYFEEGRVAVDMRDQARPDAGEVLRMYFGGVQD